MYISAKYIISTKIMKIIKINHIIFMIPILYLIMIMIFNYNNVIKIKTKIERVQRIVIEFIKKQNLNYN